MDYPLFKRYKLLLESYDGLDKSALQMGAFDSVNIYYAPFDYVTPNARICIVGLTPGKTQMDNAINAVKKGLRQGLSDEEVLKEVKRLGSFSGPLRKNLVRMLDHMKVNEFLGIKSCGELFSNRTHLAEFTSCIRYPAFSINKEGKEENFNKSISSRNLKSFAQPYIIEVLETAKDAVIIPLGAKVSAFLEEIAMRYPSIEKRLMPALPHPSGANAERIAYFIGEKSRNALSSKTNANALDALKVAFKQKLDDLRSSAGQNVIAPSAVLSRQIEQASTNGYDDLFSSIKDEVASRRQLLTKFFDKGKAEIGKLEQLEDSARQALESISAIRDYESEIEDCLGNYREGMISILDCMMEGVQRFADEQDGIFRRYQGIALDDDSDESVNFLNRILDFESRLDEAIVDMRDTLSKEYQRVRKLGEKPVKIRFSEPEKAPEFISEEQSLYETGAKIESLIEEFKIRFQMYVSSNGRINVSDGENILVRLSDAWTQCRNEMFRLISETSGQSLNRDAEIGNSKFPEFEPVPLYVASREIFDSLKSHRNKDGIWYDGNMRPIILLTYEAE